VPGTLVVPLVSFARVGGLDDARYVGFWNFWHARFAPAGFGGESFVFGLVLAAAAHASGSFETLLHNSSFQKYTHQRALLNPRGSMFAVRLAETRSLGDDLMMRTVQEIEKDIRNLSPDEKRKIRDFLDDLVEDEMEFTDEFESQIRQSEAEFEKGMRPRVRKI
jgi:hypothetical protein